MSPRVVVRNTQRNPESYTKNYLTDVVFRIDFSPILKINKEPPVEFQNLIIQNYPILEPLENIDIQILDTGKEFTSKKEISKTWKFMTTDKKEFVELSNSHLAISSRAYLNFQSFKNKIVDLVNFLYQIYPEIVLKRIGLRYINQIKLNETSYFEWSNYLNEQILSGLEIVDDKTKLKRVINTSEWGIDEDTTMRFIYGIYNSVYPAQISQKEFLLDFDCFSQIQITKDEILSKADHFHEAIEHYFELCITDQFRQHLNHE